MAAPTLQDEWRNKLCSSYCSNMMNCCYGTCFPWCALASAKSLFDGSSWCFNCVCFGCSPSLVRNYIRSGYKIQGRVGVSDCCIPLFFTPCVVTQLLNEVGARGPRIVSISKVEDAPWIAPQKSYSCLGDPCDFCMTVCFMNYETANIYSQLSGMPLWFGLFPGVNLCQTQHLVRKSYGIGGDDCCDDCCRPTCCMLIPYVGQIYLYKELASLRQEIGHRGRPVNYSLEEQDIVASVELSNM